MLVPELETHATLAHAARWLTSVLALPALTVWLVVLALNARLLLWLAAAPELVVRPALFVPEPNAQLLPWLAAATELVAQPALAVLAPVAQLALFVLALRAQPLLCLTAPSLLAALLSVFPLEPNALL